MDEAEDKHFRAECAKSVAPYLFPRLSNVDVRNESDNRLVIELVDFTKKPLVSDGGVIEQSLTLSLPHPQVDIEDD